MRANRVSGMLRRLTAAAVLVGVAGCGDAALKESNLGNIQDVITSLATLDGSVTASLVSGTAPAANGGPTISVAGVATAINGGSMRVTVSSATPFSSVVLGLTYFDGYYQLDLPAPVTSADVVVSMHEQAPRTTMAFLYEAAPSGGPFGSPMTQNVNILRVGSGDIQVSVSWDSPTDVDLHVVDPSSEEVFFGNLQAASGGTLDLDSNAACSIDNVNNENVVWPPTRAPTGTYNIFLVYWSACTQPQTNYVVTVLVKGQPPQIFSGTLSGGGAPGVQYPITSVTY